jgi:hypothetical protein
MLLPWSPTRGAGSSDWSAINYARTLKVAAYCIRDERHAGQP